MFLKFFPKEYYNMKWELSRLSSHVICFSGLSTLPLSLSPIPLSLFPLSLSLFLSHSLSEFPTNCRHFSVGLIIWRSSAQEHHHQLRLHLPSPPSVYPPPCPLSGKRKSRIYASDAKNNVAVRLRNPSTSADRRSHTDRRSWIASTQPSQSELLSLRLWSVADRLSLDL